MIWWDIGEYIGCKNEHDEEKYEFEKKIKLKKKLSKKMKVKLYFWSTQNIYLKKKIDSTQKKLHVEVSLSKRC